MVRNIILLQATVATKTKDCFSGARWLGDARELGGLFPEEQHATPQTLLQVDEVEQDGCIQDILGIPLQDIAHHILSLPQFQMVTEALSLEEPQHTEIIGLTTGVCGIETIRARTLSSQRLSPGWTRARVLQKGQLLVSKLRR
jgi:hypothetical protein